VRDPETYKNPKNIKANFMTVEMTLEEKVGQMFMVGFQGLEAPDYLLEWLRIGRVGGVILFARNIDTPAQVAQLTASLHAAAKFPLLIGIDQEGGTVARLRNGFSESPGALALSAAAGSPALAEQVDQVLGLEMRALGINWNFAPSLDIFYNAANPAIGTRSFGSTAARVAEMGVAAVRGFQSGGVAACAKHFPGLGSTAIDTHLALPILDTPVSQLIAQDMPPFRAAIGAEVASIMTTHTIFSELDQRFPATLSPVVIQRLLRQELAFDRVVISDCMEMKAIADHFSPADTAIFGAQAGLDIILFSHTRTMQEAAYEGLLDAARKGQIPHVETANTRIAALKSKYRIVPTETPDLITIREPAHLAIMLDAARAGMVMLESRDLKRVLPLASDTVLVEFASQLESGILESGGSTGFASALKQGIPDLKTVIFGTMPYSEESIQKAETLTQHASTLILATRNAYLNPAQLAIVARLIAQANTLILVCLRNPHDGQAVIGLNTFAAFRGAYTMIASCGDSTPSLQAAAEVIRGVFVPTGKLPIATTA
jgi:beta-N-acetylhexosaminidase